MPQGKLEPATWEHALALRRRSKLKEIRDSKGGASIGVIGSNSHHQRRELPAAEVRAHGSPHEQHRPRAHRRLCGVCARAGRTRASAASLRDIANAPAILLIGGDPTEEHPLLAWEIRTNVRLNKARLYIANTKRSSWSGRRRRRCGCPQRLRRRSPLTSAETIRRSTNAAFAKPLWPKNRCWSSLGEEYRGTELDALVKWGLGAWQCALRVSRRSRQLARRGRHGPVA